MQLIEFRDKYLTLLLSFLWRQWSALGIAGYAEIDNNWVIDPEALLLFSLTMARYDQRLFDEIMDWLDVNERFLNVQRLRTMQKNEQFESLNVLHAVAHFLHKTRSGIKWRNIAADINENRPVTDEGLFFLSSGAPLPLVGDKDPYFSPYGITRNPLKVRGMSQTFTPGQKATLLLSLRAFLGITSRSEILLYLLINEKGTIQHIADQTYYSWRSVQDVLFEMGRSGQITFPEGKRGRKYYINNTGWFDLFINEQNKNNKMDWICWAPLFRALEIIWLRINNESFKQMLKLEQATELRELMDSELLPRFVKAGFAAEIKGDHGVHGEDYFDYFFESINDVLRKIGLETANGTEALDAH